jgi:hypothetical protein
MNGSICREFIEKPWVTKRREELRQEIAELSKPEAAK